MAASAKPAFAFGMLLLSLTLAPGMKASSFSFSGTFQHDDDNQLYAFFVATPSTVTAQTWSFGGGTDALGQTVPSGGFDTVLSLYSASGSLIDYNTTWSCPPANVDATSKQGCGDAALTDMLDSGVYLLAVTEYYNFPNGTNLSDGFSQTGQGDFTGPNLCGTIGSFFDVFCDLRDGNYEVDIVGANAASAVPEPGTVWTGGFVLLGFASLAFAKRLWQPPSLRKSE